jgi:hypothetical protein
LFSKLGSSDKTGVGYFLFSGREQGAKKGDWRLWSGQMRTKREVTELEDSQQTAACKVLLTKFCCSRRMG